VNNAQVQVDCAQAIADDVLHLSRVPVTRSGQHGFGLLCHTCRSLRPRRADAACWRRDERSPGIATNVRQSGKRFGIATTIHNQAGEAVASVTVMGRHVRPAIAPDRAQHHPAPSRRLLAAAQRHMLYESKK
jgi:hypothetical protein